MSLPLSRRIARVALLVAAGAAPVVGAAGSASAVDLPMNTPVSGLGALDSAQVAETVDGATTNTTGVAGNTGSKVVKKAVPQAGKAVGKGAKKAAPAAQKATGGAGGLLGGLTAGKSGLPLG
ncbi:ATP-binding protein [Streptomyces sp. LE64]|uniref:ATP-binding protein n=1 Tax=unclassified Streptomyces TaxID=2593676 RepID=UPI0033232616